MFIWWFEDCHDADIVSPVAYPILLDLESSAAVSVAGHSTNLEESTGDRALKVQRQSISRSVQDGRASIVACELGALLVTFIIVPCGWRCTRANWLRALMLRLITIQRLSDSGRRVGARFPGAQEVLGH